ncbi:hypothetical protein [Persicitalea sp.]|uniref:hypothetical protein n=1 Tax=Persicitalea sp. TaxID=3100273 RepID=UPI0035947949
MRDELKALIVNEENEDSTLTLMEEIEAGLREVKAIREGKIAGISYEDLKKEIQSEK